MNKKINTIYTDVLATLAGTIQAVAFEDRDSFIMIDFNNIMDDKKHNFNKSKETEGKTYGEYDYGSIMHYSIRAFAKDKDKPTIIPLRGERPDMGQREKMTDKDIAGVKELYK